MLLGETAACDGRLEELRRNSGFGASWTRVGRGGSRGDGFAILALGACGESRRNRSALQGRQGCSMAEHARYDGVGDVKWREGGGGAMQCKQYDLLVGSGQF